jgi:sugar O-acyltransferase (sialic acid O-acetyltransferase NeuD family)
MSAQLPFECVLWGSSGHGRVLSELIEILNGRILALCDNAHDASPIIDNVPLLIGEKALREWHYQQQRKTGLKGMAAIGGSRGADRLEIHDIYRSIGIMPLTIVHPTASVSNSSIIDEGSQILANSIVGPNTHIGEACIINHGAQADHDCQLGAGVHLAPGSILCGCVEVGELSMIGAGAVVLPRIRIGKNTIVGAGAVVTKNIPDNTVWIGNPARRIR